MVYLKDPHDYIHHSNMLIAACPETTRITTTYSLPRPKVNSRTSRVSKSASSPTTSSTAKASAPAPATGDASGAAASNTSRATLTLKTYDPRSGTVLKYRTDKAAEVGRLLSALRQGARGMVGRAHVEDPPDTRVDHRDMPGIESAAAAKLAVTGAANSSHTSRAASSTRDNPPSGPTPANTAGKSGKSKKKGKR